MPIKSDKCPSCGNEIVFHRRTCNVCEEPVGFPNVRKAVSEKQKLSKRYISAISSVNKRKIFKIIESFENEIESKSQIIIARPFNLFIELSNNDNSMIQTFLKQVAGNARTAEANKWDVSRESVESALHPLYADKIHYAALSLTDYGVEGYGSCHINLKIDYIKSRTSFFEENPFMFCKKHTHITGDPLPEGYRCSWEERSKLAVTKLHSQFTRKTDKSEFSEIILQDDGKDSDFIEAHIYGAMNAKLFQSICIVKLENKDKAILNAYKPIIEGKGIKVRVK